MFDWHPGEITYLGVVGLIIPPSLHLARFRDQDFVVAGDVERNPALGLDPVDRFAHAATEGLQHGAETALVGQHPVALLHLPDGLQTLSSDDQSFGPHTITRKSAVNGL